MQEIFNPTKESDGCVIYGELTKSNKGEFRFCPQIELYVVKEGVLSAYVDSHHTELIEGEIAVALSYTPHGYLNRKDTTASSLSIPAQVCEEFAILTDGKRIANPFIRDPEITSRIRDAIDELVDPATNSIKKQGLIYIILGIIADAVSFDEPKRPSTELSLPAQLLYHIEDNYKNNISPGSVSRDLGYSESHISKYFIRKIGVSIGKYVSIMRIKNVIRMMLEKEHNITYCALESGFESVRTFYRAFSAEFNCSPRDFFKKYAADNPFLLTAEED